MFIDVSAGWYHPLGAVGGRKEGAAWWHPFLPSSHPSLMSLVGLWQFFVWLVGLVDFFTENIVFKQKVLKFQFSLLQGCRTGQCV